MDTINKYTQTPIDARKEVGVEVNIQKYKYMLMSRHKHAGNNDKMHVANRPFQMWQSLNIWERL
jgi:hypothetical protein